MKRTLSVFLLLCMTLTLFSCGNGSTSAPDDNRSVVFRSETISSPSRAPSEVDELPACHGGKVLDQIPLDNGTLLQEESLTDAASLHHQCNILSASGELLFSVSPADDLGHDPSRDNPMAGEIFMLSDAVSCGDDLYVLASGEGICAYSGSGTLLWKMQKSAADLLVYGDDVLLLNEEGGVQALYKLDAEDGILSSPTALSGETGAFTAFGDGGILLTGADGCLYAGNAAGLYSLTLPEKDGGSADVTLFANWMRSGIAANAISSVHVIDAETMELALADENGDETFLRCTMIHADALPETEEITLALFSHRTDYNLLIFNYNKEHPESEIVIRDYTVYEGDQRSLVFNANLAAGDVPDMVLIWQYSSIDPMIPTYERAKIFTDLTPLMQADEEFRYDDLLSYVTEPFRLGGKQYIFPLQLNLSCWFGTADLFDGPMTMDSYLDLCEEKNLLPLSIKDLFGAAVDDHYDEENALCSFNDGTLLGQMERASELRESENPQPLLYLSMPQPTLYNYVKRIRENGMGEELVPVGVPNDDRALYMEEPLAEVFAVMEASDKKDEAMDFLKFLMDNATAKLPADANTAPDTPYTLPYGMTFYQEDIDDQLALFEGKTLKICNAFTFVYDTAEGPTGMAANMDGWTMEITREDADAFCDFLDSVTRRVNNSTPVQSIFWDEYREMQDRPTEAMLDSVQSKVSIYLAETMD